MKIDKNILTVHYPDYARGVMFQIAMEIGDRIKKLRKDLNMSQQALARQLGLTPGAVSAWERDRDRRKPDLSRVQDIAHALQTSQAYLISGIGAAKPDMADAPGPWRDKTPDDVPVYSTAAGPESGTFHISSGQMVNRVSRPQPLAHLRELYGIHAVGDVMEPAIDNGALVFVSPHSRIRPDNYVLVQTIEHQAFNLTLIARLVSRSPDAVTLRHYNPHQDIQIESNQIATMHRALISLDDVYGI